MGARVELLTGVLKHVSLIVVEVRRTIVAVIASK